MATKPQSPTTSPDPITPSQPSKPSSSERPQPPPTIDPPKTTTDTKPSEATTTPATTEPKPTTMSTVDPPVTNPSQEPPVVATTKTAEEPPVTTTAITIPPVTTTASDPPITRTTLDPPVTTTTTPDPPITTTTTDPPVITTTTTKDPPEATTTTKDPPVTRVTTTSSRDPPRSTTTPPYTTRYVTTISIVTVTTIVPQTTVISGRGTTVYITRSTTSPVPTIIQDPTQEPPPTTQIDPLTKGDGLQTWQITLIIVASLVIMSAMGAVVLVGRIKRQRRKRDSVLFNGDGLESVLGSEMGESGKSNRPLFGGGGGGAGGGGGGGGHQQQQQQQYYLAAQGGNGGDRGLYDSGDPSSGGGGGAAAPGVVSRGWGWRRRFSAWRPWDSLGSYHSQKQHPGHDYQGQGQAGGGGLWLMDDPDPHYDGSASAAVAATAAAAMRPVSYDTNGSGPGETIVGGDEDPYYYSGNNNPYNNTQSRDRYYDQNHPADATTAYVMAARERERGIAGTLHPLDENHSLAQRSPSPVTTAATAMRSRSQHQQHLQQQQQQQQQQRPGSRGGSATEHSSPSIGHLERLSGEGPDFVDTHGELHRQSQDWTISSATSGGIGVGRGAGTSGGATEDRTSIWIDPDQLESNAKFELFRKAPQAILGDDTPTSPPQGQTPPGGKSPPLPSAPPPPSSTTTAAESEPETGVIESGDKGKDDAILQSGVVSELGDQTATSIALLPVDDDPPLSNPLPVASEQQ
ncbi:MAG: hypothetical protein J3R72DRAFT_434937 [Linnemannia gamsii]|nr:MAG: hypothetical protein J3R72DRAFT_434937 [Linnemannia gamsii]